MILIKVLFTRVFVEMKKLFITKNQPGTQSGKILLNNYNYIKMETQMAFHILLILIIILIYKEWRILYINQF
jgi:hypothetical protein